MTLSVQQGDSQESTCGRRACSAALLSQRGVLAAAPRVADEDKRRVTLHSAHLKVAIGAHDQTAKDRQKSLHGLRVPRSQKESASLV